MKNVLGPIIKRIRLQQKMTQSELSRLTGFSQNTISNHENQNRSIGENEIAIYAKALQVSPQFLFDSIEQPPNKLNVLNKFFTQLDDVRQDNVIRYTEKQLAEQNEVVPLKKEDIKGHREKKLEVLAAHIDDNTTEEEMDEITAFIDSLRDED